MANIKKIEPLSEWISFELDTTILDPPIFKVRMEPIDMARITFLVADGERDIMGVQKELIIKAIKEWDLAFNGEVIPCTDEKKKEYGSTLRFILGRSLKSEDKDHPKFLLNELLEFASNDETFLKN